MTSHPDLDLMTHESYDPQAVVTVDDDLMKPILNLFVFPLLDSFRISDRLMTFEEILLSTVDENEDYHRFTDRVSEVLYTLSLLVLF